MDFLPKDKNVQMGSLVAVSLLVILILKNTEKKLGTNISNLLIGIVMLLSILLGVQMNDSDIEGFQDDDSDSNFNESVVNNVVDPATNLALENATTAANNALEAANIAQNLAANTNTRTTQAINRLTANANAANNRTTRAINNLTATLNANANALGNNVAGNNVAGNNVVGDNVAGNNVLGNNVAGNNVAGNNVAGNNVLGNNVLGNNVAGNNVDGNNVAGDNVAGNNVAGNNVAGNNVAGNNVAGNNVAGNNVAGNNVADNNNNVGVQPNDEESLAFVSVDAMDQPMNNRVKSDCYPKDILSPEELLPKDSETTWTQSNPSTKGSLEDQNFLNAGHHIGVNTVGQSLRNANRQLRSEPPNPQVKVSPWLQSTIEPDINRRPLEIGGN